MRTALLRVWAFLMAAPARPMASIIDMVVFLVTWRPHHAVARRWAGNATAMYRADFAKPAIWFRLRAFWKHLHANDLPEESA
jgi:hypothetical protein